LTARQAKDHTDDLSVSSGEEEAIEVRRARHSMEVAAIGDSEQGSELPWSIPLISKNANAFDDGIVYRVFKGIDPRRGRKKSKKTTSGNRKEVFRRFGPRLFISPAKPRVIGQQ